MKVLGKAAVAGVVKKRLTFFYNYILSYLADLFHQGGQYRMIGVHHSVISFHIPLEGVVVGQHRSMTKFMKGIFSLRLPGVEELCHLGCK